MLEEQNFAKGQRKRRLERENALNHRASLKDHRGNNHSHHHQAHNHSSRRKDQTYTKRHRQKLLQGSLENVSSNPLGENKPPESTLRRSRSLAISREDIFTNLDIPNPQRARRRSQLIPRAKLIERCNNSSRNSLQRGISHESLYTDHSTLSVLSRGPLDYPCPQQQPSGFKYREDVSSSQYLPSISHLRHSTTDLDSLEHDASNYKPQPQQVSHSQHSQHHHTEDSGLSLPNYYPDSKCDTDHSFTDNLSVGNFTRESKYRQSSLYPESANISYDENIVLGKTQLYDKVEEHYHQSKPRTIRGNTPYYNPEPETYVKPRSLPTFVAATNNNGYESDSTLSDYDPKYYEPVERTSSDSNNEGCSNQPQQLTTREDSIEEEEPIQEEPIVQELRPEKEEPLYYGGEPQVYSHYSKHAEYTHHQSDNHYHERPSYEECEAKSEFSNIEANPIYDEIPPLAADRDLIKTSIQVPPQEETTIEFHPEEYKTVVSVPEQQKPSSDEEDVKEAKKHSHNYLKEFLETQKGSKKPLQNFLSKRISRAFTSSQDNSTTDSNKAHKKDSNLIENQYFSLPDITVSKNLQKCEKIDRKLRKCEKLQKSPSDVSTNRFIVNIGNHFDVTARSSIPVDFELKISKIPKTKKNKSDKNFIEVVKTLNQTLNPKNETNKKNPKVIVNGEEINGKELFQRDKEVEVLIENTKMSNGSLNKEFQSKINTMRNYWGSMVGKESNEKEKEEKQDPVKEVVKEQGKCKIVGMQTKVEEVKKKFEADPNEKKEDLEATKPPSKVQMTKQFFEKNDAQSQKTSRHGIMENPFFDNQFQFESLNPNTLELIEQEDKYERDHNEVNFAQPKQKNRENEIIETEDTKEVKEIKTPLPKVIRDVQNTEEKSSVRKSKSIEPEFDHIRYRVVKSDLFQKKIFAKCEKESQFDGLMQYLQDYSFQELLIDNNIVIIEPIRTNIQYVGTTNPHHTNNVTKFIRTPGKPPSNNESAGLRKHFFYHPIRVNREVNDDELPNPDTVNKVRQMFEGQMPRSQSSKHLDALTKQTVQYIRPVDPDKDRCSASDGSSNMSECDENDDYDEEADVCCEYVSEDILEKIRECGTSVTYYGGRVTAKRKPPAMTKAIMEEIQNQRNQKAKCNCACKFKARDRSASLTGANESIPEQNQEPTSYQGVKFKLLKSNSCSSRLELVGTKNLSEYRKKFIMKQKQILDEHNLKKQNMTQNINKNISEKNHINESIKDVNVQSNVQLLNNQNSQNDQLHPQLVKPTKIKKPKETGNKPFTTSMNVTLADGHNNGNSNNHNTNQVTHVTGVHQTPKIIGEEMKAKKLIQWGEMREENKTYSGITYTHNIHNGGKQKVYDFYEKVKMKPKKPEEMEFEPYEVAN